jgi:hypothetical protein
MAYGHGVLKRLPDNIRQEELFTVTISNESLETDFPPAEICFVYETPRRPHK